MHGSNKPWSRNTRNSRSRKKPFVRAEIFKERVGMSKDFGIKNGALKRFFSLLKLAIKTY